MEITFVTKNRFKFSEASELLADIGVTLKLEEISLSEIQTEKIEDIVRDKSIKAFKRIGKPLFIEHTGLYITSLGGFPGGLTQVFWDKLTADPFAKIFGSLPDTTVIAKTIIGYCDGKKIYTFSGEIHGNIASEPKGDRSFQWDCVFIPQGYSETFAELGDIKNSISMRKIAFDEFKKFLKGDEE
jgi:XTP/dITP diphosphohydrolase